jgi:hypothetical protein
MTISARRGLTPMSMLSGRYRARDAHRAAYEAATQRIHRLVIYTDNNEDNYIARMSSDGTVDLHPSLHDKSPQEVAEAILHGLSGR